MVEKSIPTVPRIRTISRIARFYNNPIPILESYHEEFGDTYYMYIGGVQKAILTRSPAMIKAVLQGQHRQFEKSKLQTDMVAEYLGKGLLTNHGSDWLRQRRLIQPGFHKKKIEGLMSLMMSVINKFSAELGKKDKVTFPDFSEAMLKLSFEIIARTLISQAIPEEELSRMSRTINETQNFIIRQVRLPFLAPYNRLTGKIKQQKAKVDDMRKILLNYVQQRRASGEKMDDLLDMLLDIRYEDTGEAMTDERLIDEMLILFVAGHETTANALSWAWYVLSKQPETVERIRLEAQEFFDGPITIESLKQLSFTNQVIQEVMRLYPPAWTTDRVALEDVEVDGYLLKKGTMVMPFIYGVHRNPTIWENPGEFNPERFITEAYKSKPQFSYLPFGGGPRFCIGNNFSMIEMQLIVAKLCLHFDFKTQNEKDIKINPLITLRMDQPLQMEWKARK